MCFTYSPFTFTFQEKNRLICLTWQTFTNHHVRVSKKGLRNVKSRIMNTFRNFLSSESDFWSMEKVASSVLLEPTTSGLSPLPLSSSMSFTTNTIATLSLDKRWTPFSCKFAAKFSSPTQGVKHSFDSFR